MYYYTDLYSFFQFKDTARARSSSCSPPLPTFISRRTRGRQWPVFSLSGHFSLESIVQLSSYFFWNRSATSLSFYILILPPLVRRQQQCINNYHHPPFTQSSSLTNFLHIHSLVEELRACTTVALYIPTAKRSFSLHYPRWRAAQHTHTIDDSTRIHTHTHKTASK